MKKKEFAMGILYGAMLFGGATAVAAGVTAEPTWQNIYVDGKQVSMTAYNIADSNYVKLRDIGKEVGFNVYWRDGVQIDTDARTPVWLPYRKRTNCQPSKKFARR